jgi:hypothetical protein
MKTQTKINKPTDVVIKDDLYTLASILQLYMKLNTQLTELDYECAGRSFMIKNRSFQRKSIVDDIRASETMLVRFMNEDIFN